MRFWSQVVHVLRFLAYPIRGAIAAVKEAREEERFERYEAGAMRELRVGDEGGVGRDGKLYIVKHAQPGFTHLQARELVKRFDRAPRRRPSDARRAGP